MTQVLGTRVFELPAPAPNAFLISDLHVPADGGQALLSLHAAVAAATAQRAALLVLGDLFDSYVSRAQVHHGVWRDVADLFARAAAAGIAVEILHGNRDFLLGAEFSRRSRARIWAGGLRGAIGGVDTLLLHGDELCVNDLPYQRAKRWLRHPLTRMVARCLPLRAALGVAERARAKSREVIRSGDQTRFLPTSTALAAAFATGAQQLVFGHIHRFAHDRRDGRPWWVLPAFDAGAIGLWCRDGRVEPVCFGDRGITAVAAPTALVLPA